MIAPHRQSWLIVAGVIAAAWLALFVTYAIPMAPANATTASGITVKPKTVLIGEIPATVSIGSFTGNRAVLQFQTDARNAVTLFADLSRGQLISRTEEVSPISKTGAGGGSIRTLTLTFYSNNPIGAADYRAVISGVRYTFKCNWLNA